MKIGNGLLPESKLTAFYCGYQSFYPGFPAEHSTGRYMWIKFYSNSPQSGRTKKGFKARFEAVDISKYYRLREVVITSVLNEDPPCVEVGGAMQDSTCLVSQMELRLS